MSRKNKNDSKYHPSMMNESSQNSVENQDSNVYSSHLEQISTSDILSSLVKSTEVLDENQIANMSSVEVLTTSPSSSFERKQQRKAFNTKNMVPKIGFKARADRYKQFDAFASSDTSLPYEFSARLGSFDHRREGRRRRKDKGKTSLLSHSYDSSDSDADAADYMRYNPLLLEDSTNNNNTCMDGTKLKPRKSFNREKINDNNCLKSNVGDVTKEDLLNPATVVPPLSSSSVSSYGSSSDQQQQQTPPHHQQKYKDQHFKRKHHNSYSPCRGEAKIQWSLSIISNERKQDSSHVPRRLSKKEKYELFSKR